MFYPGDPEIIFLIIFLSAVKMSLFQFGFSVSSTQQQMQHEPENIAIAATHLPVREDAVLGCSEFNEVVTAVVDLARPEPSQS